jgi:hypothetical protein
VAAISIVVVVFHLVATAFVLDYFSFLLFAIMTPPKWAVAPMFPLILRRAIEVAIVVVVFAELIPAHGKCFMK